MVDDSPRMESPQCAERCPMCGSQAAPVQVHGHGQCADCGVNIDPCCGGAPTDDLDCAA